MSKKIITLHVNGKDHEVAVDERESLYETLRNELRLTSIKKGCEVGECGACSVLLNGKCVDSCIYLTVWAQGKDIVTVEGLKDEKFMTGAEKTDVINRDIKLCGYFVIVTSEKMTARDALALYKSRDASEKTFRGDKSYLGAHCERVYSNESVDTKVFIGFVATVIRSRMYTLLKDEMGRMETKQNYMTVPAAIKELEKIELLKGADNEYNLDYAVTATQKAILKAFGLTADSIHKQARAISSDLARVEIEAIEKGNC